jgi:Sugar (and other) transporter
MKGRHDQALQNLCFLRQLPEDHPFVQNELMDVREQLEREREATLGTSRWGKFRELVTIPSNRYRFMLGIMSQLLGQWSGASAITIYAADFFAVLGKTGQSEKLFATCILGVVKLCSAYLCAFFLIDFFGRRRSLYTGICLQTLAILYVAIYLAIVPASSLEEGSALSPSQKRAATGAIAAIYISGFGWVSRSSFTQHFGAEY